MARYRLLAEPTDTVDGWTNCTLSKPAKAEDADPCREARAALQHILAETVAADHLVVLTGLGTSLEIKEPDGKTLKFPTMPRLWELVEAQAGGTFKTVREAVNYVDTPAPADPKAPALRKNIEELLSRCQMAETLGNVKGGVDLAAFIKAAEGVISGKCSYKPNGDETKVHEDFLRRLVRRSPRKPRASLFTTNYDRCFETAASRIGLPLMDGFSFTVPQRFAADTFDFDIVTQSTYSKEPDYVPRLIRLFKLHGSVDWERTEGGIEKRENATNPLLIYPRYGKYEASYAPPFLEMMSRFQSILRNPSVGVLVVCFGFNDQHIAEPLLAAVRSNTSLRVVVVAPDLCGKDADRLYGTTGNAGAAKANQNLSQLDQLIERGDSRLTLVNAKLSEITQLIPLLPMQSEAEQQEARIRDLEMWVAAKKRGTGGTA